METGGLPGTAALEGDDNGYDGWLVGAGNSILSSSVAYCTIVYMERVECAENWVFRENRWPIHVGPFDSVDNNRERGNVIVTAYIIIHICGDQIRLR
jgi:hypothetical protein